MRVATLGTSKSLGTAYWTPTILTAGNRTEIYNAATITGGPLGGTTSHTV